MVRKHGGSERGKEGGVDGGFFCATGAKLAGEEKGVGDRPAKYGGVPPCFNTEHGSVSKQKVFQTGLVLPPVGQIFFVDADVYHGVVKGPPTLGFLFLPPLGSGPHVELDNIGPPAGSPPPKNFTKSPPIQYVNRPCACGPQTVWPGPRCTPGAPGQPRFSIFGSAIPIRAMLGRVFFFSPVVKFRRAAPGLW